MKKVKNKVRNNQSNVIREIRQVGVKVESVEHKIDLVIERQNGVEEKFAARFDELDTKADKLITDVDVIKLDIEFIKHDLKKKISIDEFAALERRVAMLERKAH